MLLVDAIYVNYGGALSLLHYLVDSLVERKVMFTLLADDRCMGDFDDLSSVIYLSAEEKKRKLFYASHKSVYSSVFCFGNVPPPIRLKVPVYTYFHNINMLTLADCRDKKQWLKFWLKRSYIRFQRKKTDEWIVQTSNTLEAITKYLNITMDNVKILPFYKKPDFPPEASIRNDYIFVGEYSGSKGHKEILKAWEILHEKGNDFTLHLTVSIGEEFLSQIEDAVNRGVRIINHGYIPREQLASLYIQCKATIYPSYNESFGLGLIEAMEANCDVIASNRPYVFAICNPSATFDPQRPESIADAVIRYEQGITKKTEQKAFDCIDELIQFISN